MCIIQGGMGSGVEPRVELALRRTIFFGLILVAYLIFGAAIFSALPKRHQTLVSSSLLHYCIRCLTSSGPHVAWIAFLISEQLPYSDKFF